MVMARSRRGLILGMSFLMSGMLVSCSRHDENSPTAQTPPPVVVVAAVTQRTVPLTQDYQGTTGAITSVEVRARVQGILESAPFKEGTLVHEGQLIFTLQRQPYTSDVQSADAQLLKGKADLQEAEDDAPVLQAAATVAQKLAMLGRANITVKRMVPLAAAKAVPQKDLDDAIQQQLAARADVAAALAQLKTAKASKIAGIQTSKSAIESASATLATAKLNLSYTQIYAPVTGLIGFLNYDVGNIVGGTGKEVLDTISTIDPIKVDFGVDENTYLAIAGVRHTPGVQSLRDQELKLVLANGNTYEYPGRLYTVNPTLDAKTGTITVEARFPNPNALLRPGQFARVRVVVDRKPNALLVPQNAVVQTQGVNSVYVVGSNNVADLRTVSLGPQYEQDYIVVSGLNAGERVVVEGTQKIRPGIKVVPQGG